MTTISAFLGSFWLSTEGKKNLIEVLVSLHVHLVMDVPSLIWIK